MEFKCPLSGENDTKNATIDHYEMAYKDASAKMDDLIKTFQKLSQENRENCDRIRRWCIEDSLEVRSYLTGLLIAVVGMAIILGVVVAYLLMG